MRFIHFSVENFGVFAGRHTFYLRSLSESESQRHITIFSGHNGAGKSTLFQALLLALYGATYFTNEHNYRRSLIERMHRTLTDAGEDSSSRQSAVTLSLEYVQSGQVSIIDIERRWRRQSGTVQETLSVLRNGKPLELDPSDYQVWLNEYISPGYGQLCFFDGEQFEALIDPSQQGKTLSGILMRLLGLDIVNRLEMDLRQVLSRQGGSSGKVDNLYKRALALRAETDHLQLQVAEISAELERVHTSTAKLERMLRDEEHRLSAEGGRYAAQRPLLEQRKAEINKQIEEVSNALRELCSELLPFALVPELCLQLVRTLEKELEIQRQQVASTFWSSQHELLDQLLTSPRLWEGVAISETARSLLVERIKQAVGQVLPSQEEIAPLTHHLAEPDHRKLKQWIITAVQLMPRQVEAHTKQLRALKRELQRVEKNLERAPDDSVIAPIYTKIAELKAQLEEQRKRELKLTEQLGSLRFQIEEKQRELKSLLEAYEKAQRAEKQRSLAELSLVVLRTYQDALLRQKLSELAHELTLCFNQLCHKDDLIAGAEIDLASWKVQFTNSAGQSFTLEHLSAGERQLYALALLWALRRIGNRDLPLAIDTPLARLDIEHRQRFLRDYIGQISKQVLLFTTDSELDSQMLGQIDEHVSRVYQLNYDPQRGETAVSCQEPTAKQAALPNR